jgi:hypothetical protein
LSVVVNGDAVANLNVYPGRFLMQRRCFKSAEAVRAPSEQHRAKPAAMSSLSVA